MLTIGARMTNQLAIILGTLILGGIIADVALNSGETLVFLLQKFLELIEWTAFWR
ncbi:MAG: hypothetical protein AAGH17_05500 [Pseudomonadota bacterium]